MKLTTVLNLHSSNTSPNSLKDNLGDGFLIKHNPIFRSIRESALKHGFSFSTEFNPSYQTLPMGQLEAILQSKKIPYSDNVSPLMQLNERAPSMIEWDHVVDNLKPNYLFHESCHAVARSEKPAALLKLKRPVERSDENLFIAGFLAEESFANTCEFLAIAYAQDTNHRLFLEMNSFFTIFEDRTLLKKSQDTYGLEAMTKFMFFCYMQSNFLRDSINSSELNQIIEFATFPKTPDTKLLKSLAQNAFALNPRFRFTTTELYLRIHGIIDPVQKALDFDPMALIKGHENFLSWINRLFGITSNEFAE